jgi:hypothetical protein
LHELLASHPEVLVPAVLKEVHYFDRHYDEGEAWYRRFFAHSGRNLDRVIAVGEVTPHYIYGAECMPRIHAMPSVQKLIVMMRDPVTRAWSHYRWRRARRGYAKTFEELLEEDEAALRWGMYGSHLAPYLDLYGRDRLLLLVQEQTRGRVVETRERIAAFLGVDPEAFPSGAGHGMVNAGFDPRFGRLTSWLVGVGRGLRSAGFYKLVRTAKRSIGRRLFSDGGRGQGEGGMLPETERRLRELYAPDIALLERLTGLALDAWKGGDGGDRACGQAALPAGRNWDAGRAGARPPTRR